MNMALTAWDQSKLHFTQRSGIEKCCSQLAYPFKSLCIVQLNTGTDPN